MHICKVIGFLYVSILAVEYLCLSNMNKYVCIKQNLVVHFFKDILAEDTINMITELSLNESVLSCYPYETYVLILDSVKRRLIRFQI